MIRFSEAEGDVCSTCKHSRVHIDLDFQFFYLCAKHPATVITYPDEQVCDSFK